MTVTTYQSSYGATIAKGLPGQVVSSENTNRVSRTIESAAGIEFGQPAFRGSNDHGVVLGGTYTATGVGAARAGNTGNGTITANPTISSPAKEGVYTITMLEPATNAGEFSVEDPDGVSIGNGTVAVAYAANGLSFTIADGATDFAAGDQFTITTTYTANTDFLGIAILTAAVPAASATPDKYPQYYTGAFLTEGPIWVTAGGNVADGDDAYWNPATKRYTADTSHVRIPGAKFDTTGVNGDMVELVLGGGIRR